MRTGREKLVDVYVEGLLEDMKRFFEIPEDITVDEILDSIFTRFKVSHTSKERIGK